MWKERYCIESEQQPGSCIFQNERSVNACINNNGILFSSYLLWRVPILHGCSENSTIRLFCSPKSQQRWLKDTDPFDCNAESSSSRTSNDYLRANYRELCRQYDYSEMEMWQQLSKDYFISRSGWSFTYTGRFRVSAERSGIAGDGIVRESTKSNNLLVRNTNV